MDSRDDLEKLTRKDLLLQAQDLGIPRRTALSKAQLVDAILGARSEQVDDSRRSEAESPSQHPGVGQMPSEDEPSEERHPSDLEVVRPSLTASEQAATAGDSALVILVIDPCRAHAWWNVAPLLVAAAREVVGGPLSPLILRVHDVTLPWTDLSRDAPIIDAEVDSPKGSVYLRLPLPGRTIVAEIGLRGPTGVFAPLLGSNRAALPRGREGDAGDLRLATVRGSPPALWGPRSAVGAGDAPRGASRPLAQFASSGDARDAGDAMLLAEAVTATDRVGSVWRQSAAPAASDSTGNGWGDEPPAPEAFSVVVAEDLIALGGSLMEPPEDELVAVPCEREREREREREPPSACEESPMPRDLVAAKPHPVDSRPQTGNEPEAAAVRERGNGFWVEPRPLSSFVLSSWALAAPPVLAKDPLRGAQRVELEAELVLRGRSDPSAEVFFAGVLLPRRADGSFTVRLRIDGAESPAPLLGGA